MNGVFASDKKLIANILFIVAAIQLLLGGLYGWFYISSSEFTWQGWLFVLSPAVYLLLGLAARKFPSAAVFVGFVLYLYMCFAVFSPGQAVWQDGLVLKPFVLFFLLWGFLLEKDWRQPRQKWRSLINPAIILFYLFTGIRAVYLVIILHLSLGLAGNALVEFSNYLSVNPNLPRQSLHQALVSLHEQQINFSDAVKYFQIRSALAGCVAGLCLIGLFSRLFSLFKRSPTSLN